MYACTMPVPDPGWRLGARPPQEAVSVLKKNRTLYDIASKYGNSLVEVGCFGSVWDVLEWFWVFQ